MLYRFYVGLGWVEDAHFEDVSIARADHYARQVFGGFTRSKAVGGWISDGESYHENTAIYEIFSVAKTDIYNFQAYLAAVFHQEKVLVLELEAREIGP